MLIGLNDSNYDSDMSHFAGVVTLQECIHRFTDASITVALLLFSLLFQLFPVGYKVLRYVDFKVFLEVAHFAAVELYLVILRGVY